MAYAFLLLDRRSKAQRLPSKFGVGASKKSPPVRCPVQQLICRAHISSGSSPSHVRISMKQMLAESVTPDWQEEGTSASGTPNAIQASAPHSVHDKDTGVLPGAPKPQTNIIHLGVDNSGVPAPPHSAVKPDEHSIHPGSILTRYYHPGYALALCSLVALILSTCLSVRRTSTGAS